MMKRLFISIIGIFLSTYLCNAQLLWEISGKGKDAEDKKPVFKDLINIWFIIFFVWEILETALSVSPL